MEGIADGSDDLIRSYVNLSTALCISSLYLPGPLSLPSSIRDKCSLSFMLALSAWPFPVLSTPFGYIQVNRVTRLFGSSFGLLDINATFDYVVSQSLCSGYTISNANKVVGGGTAGLTVAERLAEDPPVSVAVIEAGSFYEIDNGDFSQIPTDDSQHASSKSFLDTAAYRLGHRY